MKRILLISCLLLASYASAAEKGKKDDKREPATAQKTLANGATLGATTVPLGMRGYTVIINIEDSNVICYGIRTEGMESGSSISCVKK